MKQKKYGHALKMFKLAADQGDILSQRRLADLYALGLGCNVDHGEAIKYYELAMSQGDELAKKSLELQNMPLLNLE